MAELPPEIKRLKGRQTECKSLGTKSNSKTISALTITTTEETSQLKDIIKPVIDTDNSMSRTSTSCVNLLSTRPSGVVSKYDIGARSTLAVICLNIMFAHLAPPATDHSDRTIVANVDRTNITA